MHNGKSYRLSELLVWTKRTIFWLIILGIVPPFLYQVIGLKWLAIPWTVVALLGTATAFIVGFKNTQTYNRTWEARKIWGAILNCSRTWGVMCRDFLSNPTKTKELVYRHFAWLTALRYQMRDSRVWETTTKAHNKDYKVFYTIPEKETTLESELAKYISAEELKYILTTKNRAVQLISVQSKTLKELFANKELDSYQFIEMEKMLKDIYDNQGKSERIKNFPYPRQFATINTLFIKLFSLLLPFGMLKEFDRLNESMEGIMKGNMVWLVIPFSVLISWVYTSLEQVGESTENPFEGGANDVPISQMSRAIEIDLREMLGPFKMGGLNGYPFAGVTGMNAFANHVPENGAVVVFYAPHIGITKSGVIGEINRIGQTGNSSCCGAAKGALGKLLKNQIEKDNVTELDYQMNTIEQIFLKQADRIKSAESQIFEATEVMYEAINDRIETLVSKTNYSCKYVILIGAIFINGDKDMGSFCLYKRFDCIDLTTKERTNLMEEFNE